MSAFRLLLIVILSISCAQVDRVAVNSTASMIKKASRDMEEESNYQNFVDGTLPNLKFIEGLLQVSPENENLLLAAMKANAGYAFGHLEVNILRDKIDGKKSSPSTDLALKYYSKALYWGNKLFATKGLAYKDLLKSHQNQALSQLLDDNFSKEDDEFIFYYAQTLAALINLQRKSAIMLAQLSLAKDMFDYVCVRNPSINYGACELFYGAYEAGRPKMFGGNMEKGKQHFINGLGKYPENQLLRTSYVIYYILARKDKTLLNAELEKLEKFFKTWNKQQVWKPGAKLVYGKRTNLFNAIAFEQFKILKKVKL